jgi:hypothetical protein
VRQNPQHRSLLTVVLATYAPGWAFQTCLKELFDPAVNRFYATNTSYRKQETFNYEYSLHWVVLPIKNAKQNVVFW